MSKGKKTLTGYVGLIFGAAALSVFIYRLRGQWEGMYRAAVMINYGLMMPVLLILALMYALRILRLRLLLMPVARVSAGRITRALFIGLLANNIMPARAGELIRPYVLQRGGNVSYSRALAVAALDRIFDMAGILILFFFAAGLFLFPDNGGSLPVGLPNFIHRGSGLVLAVAGVTVATGALVFFLFFPQKFRRGAMKFAAVLPQRMQEPCFEFIESAAESASCLSRPRRAAVPLLYSTGAWFLQGVSTYVVALGSGIDVGPGGALLITLAVCFAIALPQAPGYLGTYHLAAAVTMESMGVPEAQAAAFAVVLWAINIFPITFLGAVLSVCEGIGRGEMKESG